MSIEVPDGQIVALAGQPTGPARPPRSRPPAGCCLTRTDAWLPGASASSATTSPAGWPTSWRAAGLAHVREGRHIFADLTVEENLIAAGNALGGRGRARHRAGLQLLPAPAGATQAGRGLPLGRRAADAGHRPRAGRQAAHDPAWTSLRWAWHRWWSRTSSTSSRASTASRALPCCWWSRTRTWRCRVAHHGYIVENGRIVISGPTDTLLNDPDVQRFYLGAGDSGEAMSTTATSNTTSAASAG
jgi:branched-chain amino acid transport system ATP-binding protein